MRYEHRRNVALPWGYWLRLEGGPGSVSYVDEEGRRWSSVRSCLWESRLGMSPHNERIRDEALELLLAALASRDMERRHPVAEAHDIYGGHATFYRYHVYWLLSTGLIEIHHGGAPFDAKTSLEGRAVVAMLMATRQPLVQHVPIGREAMRLSGEPLARASFHDQNALDAFEAKAAALTFAFVRADLGRLPLVALDHRPSEGLMPTARRIWSQSFPDAVARDAFYAWLVRHVDRWDEWGGVAWRQSAHALTQRLLALTTVTMVAQAPVARGKIALPRPD